MNSTKLSGYRTGIKFNNSVLVVEQNNYASKIVNVYIVYDEDTWPKNPLNNFIIFCVENVSSSHTDNWENDFLILVEGPTFSVNGNFGSPEKSLVLILVKQRQCFV